MNKVELAKMLGLVTTESHVGKWEIKDLLETDWMVLDWVFNAGVSVEITKGDLGKDKLDINLEDLEEDGDIEVCIKQCEDLIWERAADKYLGKIKGLVETINVGS